MSKVWEYTNGCAKQYMRALAIYLMNVLSNLYDIIMDVAINATGNRKNVIDGLNATDKRYLKGEMEFIGKFGGNDTSKIGMLPSASKDVFINFSDQYIHIINNKEILNGLKGSTKIQKRESLLK